MTKKLEKILDFLGSLQLTLFCLGLMMFLVFFGTLAQTNMGTFAAQKEYFGSFWIYALFGDVHIPLFPGGLTVGGLWLINLLAAFIVRFHFGKKNLGILISHFGLILLVAGQGLTQMMAKESRMAIQEGQTSNFIEAARDAELAFTMISDPASDTVVSIPLSILTKSPDISTPLLPFHVKIHQFFLNADLQMGAQGKSIATQGIGSQILATELPPTTKDDEQNNASAYVEIIDGEKSLGTWLVSMSLGAPQSFFCQGKEYRLSIRNRRQYLPFQMTLKDFKHDVYPGTDIPKNFSSLIHLSDPKNNEDRDVLIYMNHPLRYAGKTFYQASFGENDTLSIFQVVENPAWLTPYISCTLVCLGLALQFLMHLIAFSKESR